MWLNAADMIMKVPVHLNLYNKAAMEENYQYGNMGVSAYCTSFRP